MTKLFKIELDSIKCSQPRSAFSEDDIELIAQQILTINGVVKPVILKELSFDNYEVIDGYLEYYAALRASEIDIAQSEVNAVIISPEQEEAATIQIKTIKPSQSQVTQTTASNIASTSQDSAGLIQRLNEIEKRIDKSLTNFREQQQEIQRNVDSRLNKFEEKLPQPIDALETFNEAEIDVLVYKLRFGGLSNNTHKVAESIIKERKKSKFKSLPDVVQRIRIKLGKRKIKGISDKKMLELIDNWLKPFDEEKT